MLLPKSSLIKGSVIKGSLKALLITLLAFGITLILETQPDWPWMQTAQATPASTLVAYLPPGNAITDANALLRNALPIDSPEIREVQAGLENLSEWLRSKRWNSIKSDIKQVEKTLSRKTDKILAAVPEANRAQASVLLSDLSSNLSGMAAAAEARDKEAIWTQRAAQLARVTTLEEMMVKGFPFAVPEDYQSLPQLKGRATVRVETTKGPIEVVVDGFSAPVTAGNFVDLVQRGFYDGLPFIRAEDFYVLQTGDPKGEDQGFIDPQTQQYRAIPLEILVKGDKQPVYGDTLEALGRFLDAPVLPFSAYGTVAMARPESDPNGGSSQFFFFLFEPELTPAGLNLLDGRYSVFGYVTAGKEVLRQLGQGDTVTSAKVMAGLENLDLPQP